MFTIASARCLGAMMDPCQYLRNFLRSAERIRPGFETLHEYHAERYSRRAHHLFSQTMTDSSDLNLNDIIKIAKERNHYVLKTERAGDQDEADSTHANLRCRIREYTLRQS